MPGLAQQAPPASGDAQTQTRPTAAAAGRASNGAISTPGSVATVAADAAPAAPAPTAATAQNLQFGTSSEVKVPVSDHEARPAANAEIATAAAVRQTDLPHNLSAWGMFMAADRVVKTVMIGLAAASVATWTVLIAKIIELGAVQRALGRAMRCLTAAPGLAAAEEMLAGHRDAPAQMVKAAREEMDGSDAVIDLISDVGVKERVASRLQRMEVRAGRRIAKGTGLLATIGSTAPFVGLFGTVWGIMNAFIGISKAQTTNLAIVAPGIAEALLATAIGLVAAIPAVVIYNVLVRAITGYRQGLTDASAAIERLVSRDLDRRRAKLAAQRGTGNARPDPALVRIG
ncbi:tonB-system energizer ExbB [Mycoplana ramosa]|uniref:Biopolymer transport protein ExbB n=1 Tax=Mycoplana ramosa TaxID=40837 RepID=A0ABW3YQU9_MYCRA